MTMHQISQGPSTKKRGRLQWCRAAVGSIRAKNYQMDAHFRGGPSSGSWLALVTCKMMVFATLFTGSHVLSGLASPSILQIGLSVLGKHFCRPFLQGYLIRRFSEPFHSAREEQTTNNHLSPLNITGGHYPLSDIAAEYSKTRTMIGAKGKRKIVTLARKRE